jgi:pyruvate/2-oxoglutarate dehydrogenase complex dihydrolipoamide dehydrogenase (E3) component
MAEDNTQETAQKSEPAPEPTGPQEIRQEIGQEIRADICVIGAGAGGLTAAAAAAAFGAHVVLIEQSRLGGATLHNGSLPAQALIAAAERAHAVRTAPRFGIKTVRFGVDFAAVRAHVQEVIAAVAPLDSRERFAGMGVRVIEGAASFADRETVTVNGSAVKARRFIIATGSLPDLPAIPGLADVPFLTNEDVFELDECPRHLIVIGGGAAALEMAQAFRRLGAYVIVLSETLPLAGYDGECATLVTDALARDGVALRSGVTIIQARHTQARVQVDVVSEAGAETIEGSHLLVMSGRRPNIAALDLDRAGIRHTASGVTVDTRLVTSNKRVHAIGDVIDAPKGMPAGTHAAQYHAGLVIRAALFRTKVKADGYAVPRVTFTDPQMAQVGLTEEALRARRKAFRVLRSPYSENDRAAATGETAGHIKVVADRAGGILGVTLVGRQAAETIAIWALAINQRLNIEALAGVIVPYPTYSEVGKRAAMNYFSGGLTSSRGRRIMGWLRRFG